MLRCAALVCLTLISLTASGQTRYIADDIPITLRTGPSLENRILRNLSAGVRVEVLETDEANGYTRIRVASDGTEGWLLTRYLQAQPIARDRLGAAERNLEAARARVQELETQVAELSNDLARTRAELEALTTRSSDTARELQDIRAASANAVALRDQNEQLRQRAAEADQRINRLVMENTELKSDGRQSWFLVGAGVLFAGILVGLVAPSLRRKKRSSW
jgi:SH3 domain protein